MTTHSATAQAPSNARPPKGDAELRYWLDNMIRYHRFSVSETAMATGISEPDIVSAVARLGIGGGSGSKQPPPGNLLMLPYPGGRHPRIGFLDGAVDPQRETKVSVFAPWRSAERPDDYVVIDVPEAIWSNLGLTYLAHTHVDTIWTKKGIALDRMEWTRRRDGSFSIARRLPNGIAFGASVKTLHNSVRMELWIKNGTPDTLTGLRIQNCVMLRMARGFEQQTNDNKLLTNPYVAAHTQDRTRWIITGWERCVRPWGNPPCPCLHSDPQFADCPPGTTQRLRGVLWFHEGTDIDAERKRMEETNWRSGGRP